DELPVVSEWQMKIYCPNCKHYSIGQCVNPARKSDNDACPLTNVEPVELKPNYKFEIHQKVRVNPHNVYGKIINRKASTIGILYEITTDDNRFWITENHLE
nr:hypothetical protein [Candidatus Dadabacteria bacterium]